MESYRQKAAAQLGTVGSGNHYVDLLRDEDGFVWIGVHFGSRGLGHASASRYLKAAGGKSGINVPPALIDEDSELGRRYIAAMELAGRYAYADREWVVERVRRIIGGAVTDTVHNHHNYAWRETHEGRDVWGKTCDLAFGYQGGLNAWRKFEPDRFTDAEVEQFKQDWRAAHPNIKKFWYAIDRATWEAVRNREQVIRCGRLLLKCTGSYLFIKLPSGRKLAYPYPRIEIEDLQHEVVVFKDASQGQWRDCRGGNGAYGGLWTENIVSGMCRDLLATAMLRLEAAGYRVVLHVHDEIIAEVPEDFGSVEEFTRLMIASPAWALGLPIAAKAWTGPRFSKT